MIDSRKCANSIDMARKVVGEEKLFDALTTFWQLKQILAPSDYQELVKLVVEDHVFQSELTVVYDLVSAMREFDHIVQAK